MITIGEVQQWQMAIKQAKESIPIITEFNLKYSSFINIEQYQKGMNLIMEGLQEQEKAVNLILEIILTK